MPHHFDMNTDEKMIWRESRTKLSSALHMVYTAKEMTKGYYADYKVVHAYATSAYFDWSQAKGSLWPESLSWHEAKGFLRRYDVYIFQRSEAEIAIGVKVKLDSEQCWSWSGKERFGVWYHTSRKAGNVGSVRRSWWGKLLQRISLMN